MSNLLKLNPNFEPAFDGEKIARELVLEVKKTLPICDAFLFGSSAIKRNSINSDIDILLVIPDDKTLAEYTAIIGQPHFSKIAVDWVVKNKTEFLKRKDIGGVCFIAYHQGVRIT